MDRKRPRETSPYTVASEASTLNTRVFKKIKTALERDPEVDLLKLLPSEYSARLEMKKKVVPEHSDDPHSIKFPAKTSHNSDIRFLLSASDVEIIDPPSEYIQDLMKGKWKQSNPPSIIEKDAHFPRALIKLIQEGDIISKGPVPSRRMVVKCGEGTIAKLVWGVEEYTEYTTLKYLEKHRPSIPAPKPHGLIRMGSVTIYFTSYLLGTMLETVWADLADDSKSSIRDQLNTIFRDLRSMEFPSGSPLGGVAGEGCKDQRRHLRRSNKPIFTVKEFENFFFSDSKYGSVTFINFLRGFISQRPTEIVFTHGDLRPANILVKNTGDGRCIVSGIVDWEDSGFYPDYHEARKITNCLATNEDGDWFCFVPPCISPHSYPSEWLLDYVWGRHLE